MQNSMHRGGFFQNMVHSGVNAYLTLDMAQSLLRRGDSRYADLIRSIMRMASPTGHWPEAVHPFSEGGCMGDGQHGWAAADWVMMVRNMFVREEEGVLILGSGLLPEWLDEGGVMSFGPTNTPYGPVTVVFTKDEGGLSVECRGWWRTQAPALQVRVPGYRPLDLKDAAAGGRLEAEN
jgi:hypothetical protein